MTKDSLHDRGKAMEDQFFHDVDQKLLDKMKSELSAEEGRAALMSVAGIQDMDVINDLIEQGISAETLAGFGLIPLVAVAWADGKMEDNEKKAILSAAKESGIREEDASYALISSWLNSAPGDSLLNSWKEYVAAMKRSLDPAAVGQIKKSVIDRAKRVSDSAGGFLGVHKTSAVEQKVIDELEAAFG